MEPQLKEEVENILVELGLSTTQALTLFYRQIRMNRGIPFDIRIPEEKKHASISSAQNASTFPIDVQRSTMMRNAEAYKAMHKELVKRYLGQYVAICNEKLVDHDPDPVALLRRVRNEYPHQVVLRRKVELTPEREWRIRHPRIEKAS
jgi:DNA-damage-inducible protein J